MTVCLRHARALEDLDFTRQAVWSRDAPTATLVFSVTMMVTSCAQHKLMAAAHTQTHALMKSVIDEQGKEKINSLQRNRTADGVANQP